MLVLCSEEKFVYPAIFGFYTFGNPDNRWDINNYADELRNRLKIIHSQVREKIRVESDRMKTCYGMNVTGRPLKEGKKVWFDNPARKKGRSPKFQKNWEGPYFILIKINDLVYRIQRTPRAKMKIFQLDRLRPYAV